MRVSATARLRLAQLLEVAVRERYSPLTITEREFTHIGHPELLYTLDGESGELVLLLNCQDGCQGGPANILVSEITGIEYGDKWGFRCPAVTQGGS